MTFALWEQGVVGSNPAAPTKLRQENNFSCLFTSLVFASNNREPAYWLSCSLRKGQ